MVNCCKCWQCDYNKRVSDGVGTPLLSIYRWPRNWACAFKVKVPRCFCAEDQIICRPVINLHEAFSTLDCLNLAFLASSDRICPIYTRDPIRKSSLHGFNAINSLSALGDHTWLLYSIGLTYVIKALMSKLRSIFRLARWWPFRVLMALC